VSGELTSSPRRPKTSDSGNRRDSRIRAEDQPFDLVPVALRGLRPQPGTHPQTETTSRVYLSENRQLRWVTSPAAMEGRCLPWRHIRIVPDGSLAAFPRGPDVVAP
jgi:hypothetical protein